LFLTKIKSLFLLLIILSSIILIYNFYQDYIFDNNPISNEIHQDILIKTKNIQQKIKRYYHIHFNPPIFISNKMPHKIYGLTIYTKQNNIEILLNKKRFKESRDYMINNVLPHEYAHALMFRLGNFNNKNAGHSIKWQNACLRLGGLKCNRFVNYHDIAMGKANLWR